MLDLESLNPAQTEAVETTEGPLLVLAGAGSGKTRVLTYRIAHLVEDLGVAPWNILAVTFTNKAATEMRERLHKLMQSGIRGMWIYTFHSMCVRMLRADADRLGFTGNFSIYDADDSKRLIKSIMADSGYNTKTLSENTVRSRISAAKNELVGPDDYVPRVGDPADKAVARIYKTYQQRLLRANALDFDDLLFYAYILLRDNTDVRDEYGRRFRYILVDEYQDTNKAQYEITKMLARGSGNLMVVGDDDQSIYSWRGADIRNILDFERDWPATKTVKLEQNYRSTGNILNAANAVIANNRSRKSKTLFTDAPDGEKVAVFLAADERDEGRWIASQIEKLHDAGESYDEMAVFYRTNAQSRTLEDMFLRAGVPYRIVGGTRFFDRAEIRDVTAYLKLAVNPSDDVSCMRVINTPRRGIGKTTIQRIAQTAALRQIPFFEAAREESLDPACRAGTRRALASFVELIDEVSTYRGDLSSVVEMIVEKSSLVSSFEAQHTEEAQTRAENIREFMGVVHDFVSTHELVADRETLEQIQDAASRDALEALDEDPVIAEDGSIPRGFHVPTLSDFMEWLSLRTDLDTLGDDADETVTFMTVHSAKGLEFDTVFVAGMEESIFPHRSAIMENGVEEERRLAYVAITRARKRLFLTYAQTRRIFNDTQANARSRFINEMPKELLKHEGIGSLGMSGTGWEKRGDRRGIAGSGRGKEMYGGHVYGKGADKGASSGPRFRQAAESDVFAVGDRVDHKTFGIGQAVGIDGDKLTIRFSKSGKTKKLLKGYAPIVKLEQNK